MVSTDVSTVSLRRHVPAGFILSLNSYFIGKFIGNDKTTIVLHIPEKNIFNLMNNSDLHASTCFS